MGPGLPGMKPKNAFCFAYFFAFDPFVQLWFSGGFVAEAFGL
jgi:hypothetical protein